MRHHADRKAVLEIEFKGEEGHGLGPTLEFYALVAAELQRKTIGLWLCDDEIPDDSEREVDLGRGVKPPGYYVQRSSGLFPAPLPQSYNDMGRVESLFQFMGMLFAKCIQDSRLVDIPLSRPLLKLMCMGDIPDCITQSYREQSYSRESSADPCLVTVKSTTSGTEDDTTPTETNSIGRETIESGEIKLLSSLGGYHLLTAVTGSQSFSHACSPWYAGLLTHDDFELISPYRARFLSQLRQLSARRRAIYADSQLDEVTRAELVEALTLDGSGAKLKDLCLTFVFNPSSSIYNYDVVELKPDGENETVAMDNIDEYIELVTDFCLSVGIRRQMDAMRTGFNKVFPMDKLFMFSPSELQMILCGDQAPQWTREDIMNYTEPRLGYTKESPGFLRLVNVLVDLTADERKKFLQFATGCSSLPPGGLANLQPRLTIVRKVDGTDDIYPSVNTCVHYLKLPEYSSEAILYNRLLVAINEKGFHLD